MHLDQTTLYDLGIFTATEKAGEHFSVWHLLDHCITYKGRSILKHHVLHPPKNFAALLSMQQVIQFFYKHAGFTDKVSNGTLVMVDKFFEDSDAGHIPQGKISMAINGMFQKLLNRQGYFLTQYSITHVADLVKGCTELVQWQQQHELPALLQNHLHEMEALLQHTLMQQLQQLESNAPYATLARLSYQTRRTLKREVQLLLHYYGTLDAWRSMALATQKNNWQFPTLLPEHPTQIEAIQFYHPLLKNPVAYDLQLMQQQNFLLLTGANMSGKTTYMRALGILALLAHLGCGVPAASCSISFLHGIITNMHVEDNIMMGESYFLAEVKRIKSTAEQIVQALPHLVLMDELFKGTNVHDAFECTKAVIDGLQNHPHHLMVLSTHLYEVAQQFSNVSSIQFAYFSTQLNDNGTFKFTYQLQSGISKDRIGYRILQQEGVLKLLQQKGNV